MIWNTSDSSVATVADGVITAVGGGNATIVVSTVDGGYTARVLVVVNNRLGVINGRVYDSATSSLLSSVSVKIYKLNGSLVTTTSTNSSGSYTFSNIPFGDYKLVLEKTNYYSADVSVTLNMETYQVNNIYLVADRVSLPGKAAGKAINASTAAGIANITVYVRSGNNNTTGTVLETLTTNSSGEYITGLLNPGNYTLQFVDNRNVSSKFNTTSINVSITGDTTSYNNNAAMVIAIPEGTMKVVLTWGYTPSDLDSHLLIKGSSSNHIYYSNKSGSGANLDVDDTTSYGPETTTITLRENTKYCFYVYNFSAGSMSQLANSDAKVIITIGSTVYTFNVPSGSGHYWNVFTYDTATGEFVFNNTISNSAPSI